METLGGKSPTETKKIMCLIEEYAGVDMQSRKKMPFKSRESASTNVLYKFYCE